MDSKSIVSGLFQNSKQNEAVQEYQVIDREEMRMLQIDTLLPSENNRKLNNEFVDELAANIKLNGLLQAPVVTPIENGMYRILTGHHRVAACKKLNEEDGSFQMIRCMIKRKDEIDCELLMLDTNLKINTLNSYDRMMAIGRKEELLKEKKKRDQQKGGNIKMIIVEETGLKRSQVQTYLTIYKKACAEVKEALRKEQITLSQAASLAKKTESEQIKAINQKHEKKIKKEETDLLYKAIDSYTRECRRLDNILQKTDEEQLSSMEIDLKKFVHEMMNFLTAMEQS